MGLRASALQLILPYLSGARVLSLSYPDLVMDMDEFTQLTGLRTDGGNEAASTWHAIDGKVPETAEAFRLLGVREFKCVDTVASRGIEEVVDLNHPRYLGEWDLVIDPGTTEHCFNIGQALLNAANAVQVGGLIFHTPPLTMLNHGFYCLMPTLFHDFYGQNGWQNLHMSATDGKKGEDVPLTHRFLAPPELSLYCLVRRTNGDPLRMPTQSKYLEHPTLS